MNAPSASAAPLVTVDSGAFLICGSSKLSSAIEEADEPSDSITGLGGCCCDMFSGALILLLGPDEIIIFGLNTIAGGLPGGDI